MANQLKRPISENRLTEYKDFLEYLNIIGSESTTQEELDKLYEEYVDIEFNHHKVSIPFDAVIYNELLNLITNNIKEH